MMDKNREVEEQNRRREWRRQNHDEAKEIVAQAKKFKEIVVHVEKSFIWKGLRTNFNPSPSQHVLDLLEEEIEITIV